MEARVKQSSRYGTITAFSGSEYVKYEWRIVPAGKEEEAAQHPSLEVKQIGMDVLESLPSFGKEQPAEIAEPQPAQKPEQGEAKSSRRRK